MQFLFPAISGVDVQQGIAMTGGTTEGYRQVLSMFSKDTQERLRLLRFFLFESMTKGKLPEKHVLSFITQVHALKTASASLGAAEIPEEAERLEEAGKAGELAFIWENLSNFIDHLGELEEKISAVLKLLPEEKETQNIPKDNNPEADLSDFKELAEALKVQNALEIDRILSLLNKKHHDSATKEILEQISDQILMTEFNSAINTINELIGLKG